MEFELIGVMKLKNSNPSEPPSPSRNLCCFEVVSTSALLYFLSP